MSNCQCHCGNFPPNVKQCHLNIIFENVELHMSISRPRNYKYYKFLVQKNGEENQLQHFYLRPTRKLNFTVRVEPVLATLAAPAAARAVSEAPAMSFRLGLVHV